MKITQNPIVTSPQDSDTSTDPSVDTTTAPTLMPAVNQLIDSGDPGAMLAALVMKSGDEQRKVAREQRDQAMKAEDTADNAEIQDMHDKADLQRAQGIVDGSLQIAQGVTTIGAGCSEASGASKRTTAEWNGAGAAFGAGKSVADGFFSGAITDKDADAKQADVSANSFKQMADDAHDSEKDATDLMNKALDFYKEYVDTKAQTMMAAIHRA